MITHIGFGNATVTIEIDQRGNIELRQDGDLYSKEVQVIHIEAADADDFRKAIR